MINVATTSPIATASDTFQSDVAIQDGCIQALGTNLGDAERVIDATDMLVLPGGVDAHSTQDLFRCQTRNLHGSKLR